MEQLANSTDKVEESPVEASEPEIIEIDLANLTQIQKMSLIAVLGSFLLQIIYLLNMKFVTDLFKGTIEGSFNLVADYVIEFLNTYIPYLIILFIVLGLYFTYIILLGDNDYLKTGKGAFDTVIFLLLADLILYVIALISIPTFVQDGFGRTLPNPSYANTLELFIFLFIILLMVLISLLPFYAYKNLSAKEQKPLPQEESN